MVIKSLCALVKHHTSYCEGIVLSLDIFGHCSIILVFSLFNKGILVQLGQAVHLCQVVEESPGKDCIISSLTTSHWTTFISLNKKKMIIKDI